MTGQLPPNPLLERLETDANARVVIFHADDVGMCHGCNQAFVELSRFGIIKTGSIMAPCPWAPEILEICRDDGSLDVGVHLTLTSEWDNYRWGPLSTRDPGSGLLDEQGYFWRTTQQVDTHVNAAAAEHEMRTQIEHIRNWGIDFTHIDTHMGASLTPSLFQTYVQMGFEYQTPVLLSRHLDSYTGNWELASPKEAQWREFIGSVEEQGMLLPDWFRITPRYGTGLARPDRAEVYEEMLHALPPGVTYFSLHPNWPGDIAIIGPTHAEARIFEYHYLQSARLQQFLADEKIVSIGYRIIRDLMREALRKS